ncbi:Ig-like domain-containing protein [Jiangella alkaliphila]|uniref:LPXTG-motif cell wall anchor domain-containing protein n=1 Tax=Jiangella alkaliphila TaxID=419479 RepID=A0A1H2H7Z2_9ACTN|nr:Ig-like domain-containing protein [Jiangella alkaliphila]SDU27935.1 LPXTG-motif cell wall anchor domain-containing protein [Jiangella alkaliphila]
MNAKLPRRRGAARFAGVLVASAVVSGGVFASSAAAQADEQIPVTVPTFAADDFIELAAQLPATLREAIERDLGVAPEQYLANAERARAASDAATVLRDRGVDVLGASIDGQDVTINVASESDAAAVEASGASVVVGPLDALNTEREVQPARDHKGGYGYAYQISEPDETGAFDLSRCSVGFSGYDPDGNSRYLTAGHCGVSEETGEQFTYPVHHIELDAPIWGTEDWASEFPGPELGEFVPGSFHYGEEHDGGLVDVTGADWTGVPQVAGWGGGSGAPDDASVTIRGPIDAVAGAQACKSGATSGWTCGDILVPVQSTPVGEQNVTGFIFNACMLGGDSGGSIVVGNYALGVNSGSTHDGRTECDSWNPAQSPDTGDADFSIGYSLATGQYNALTLLGGEWELAVAVATPVVASPEDGGETGPRPTFTGTVEGARSTHKVRLVIDGEQTYEGTVTDDGAFSAAVTDELVPGEHTYEITASYGNFSRSAAAEGTFTSTEVQVEQLTVASPTDGQTTGNARPGFSGTGQPGATVTLTVGEESFGEATVGDDGAWTLTPSADLPAGERFDATVTQSFDGDSQTVTVAGLGITVPPVTIAEPEDGATVTGDVVFSGTAYPGADLTLAIEGTVTESSERVQTAADEWAGELEIGEDGAWTFTPEEALPNGEFTLTASASVEGGDPELTASEASVSFTVAPESEGDDDGDELPDTGSSNTWMIVVGVALLALGGVAIALRARRNGTTA